MRALHLAEQERAGGGDHEVAEDRAHQAVGGCVAVADEFGEGRDEGAEDDGQGRPASGPSSAATPRTLRIWSTAVASSSAIAARAARRPVRPA